jgi:hypothetical protein
MTKLFHHSKSGTYFPYDYNELKLISIGTRTKFKLVIYGIGFYTDKPELYKEVIDEKSYEFNDNKMFLLKFYRGVGYKKIMNAFIDGLQQRINLDGLEDDVNVFKNIFSKVQSLNYKDGLKLSFINNGTLSFYYQETGVDNEKKLGELTNKLLVRNIYNIYLDSMSVTPDIKNKIIN